MKLEIEFIVACPFFIIQLKSDVSRDREVG